MIATEWFVFRFGDVVVREGAFAIVKAAQMQRVAEDIPGSADSDSGFSPADYQGRAAEIGLGRCDGFRDLGCLRFALWKRLLEDDLRGPRFIERETDFGYCWLCPVELWEESVGEECGRVFRGGSTRGRRTLTLVSGERVLHSCAAHTPPSA